MKIILDAFGGDFAPLEPLMGAAQAVAELGVEIVAVGDIDKMTAVMEQNSIDKKNITFMQAPGVLSMHDDPMDVVKKRTDTSLHIAMKALAQGEGDALVSAGSTGALLMGATFIVKRSKGVKRPALASVLPSTNPKGFMLIDCGANAEVRPNMLNQFGVMGSVYMDKVAGIKNPRVALLNNGAEESKGTQVHIEAHKLMAQNNAIAFTGNIEGRDIMFDVADVVVADGFSGNIALKTSEGVATFMNKELKELFKTNLKTKIAALLMKAQLKQFKAKLDYTEYGGAPILGVCKGVIKAHGSSNAKAFKNAIRQAACYAENDVSTLIEKALEQEAEE
ncbi:MAG: phosphate acyltransferase PlsX [Oscillospiraceae bacterium]